ncbi:MAG TPA: DUF5753 domain-containing protein, partial [Micromonospora sp.]
REWIEIEQQSKALRWYEMAWVPGLLQTEGYARAVFATDGRLSAEEIEVRVAARLGRQRMLLGDSPPHFVGIVDEAVLRRAVGGSAVMREQLFHLVRLNEEHRRVRIHVVPASVGTYSGLDGPLILATLPEGGEIGYLDNRLRGVTVNRPAEIADIREYWEATLAEAMTLHQSTELIREVAKTWI